MWRRPQWGILCINWRECMDRTNNERALFVVWQYSGNKGNGLFCRTGRLPAKIGLYQGTKRKRRPVFVYRNKGRFRCGTFLPATYFYLRIWFWINDRSHRNLITRICPYFIRTAQFTGLRSRIGTRELDISHWQRRTDQQ